MSTPAVDASALVTTPQKAQAPPQRTSPKHANDKFAEARMAKKRLKRAKHRAKLSRSHTKG